jgi:3-oxoacyl-[acyl-carrier-protein] synthase-3
VLAGLGSCLPPRVVTNDELARRLDTSDEWIRSRTGIHTRHRAQPGTATSDFAVEAGRQALKSAGVDRVDAVVVATMTPDRPLPATGPRVAERLDLPEVAAFDVSSACTGFLYALAVCDGLIAAGTADSVLLIGADTFSTVLNHQDPGTAVLFGDGAGAVVLRGGEPREHGSLGPFDLGSDGQHADLATIRAGGSEQRLAATMPAPEDHLFTMQGRRVFRHAVQRMTQSGQAALDLAGWTVADVDRLVCHQANARIVQDVAHALGIPVERCVSNIDRVANTVAASIPLALADAVGGGTLRAGHRVLMIAFGGGFAWGSTTMCWPDVSLV